VVRRLHETLAGVVASPEITERLGGLAMEVVNTDPDRTAAILKDELALWAKVVRSTGARAE
jgi:tripartite-type tricarboxylate transporter receptor subunit TctC